MDNIQPDFDSEFAQQYDSFIRLALPAYDEVFPMSDTFLQQSAIDASNMLVVGAGGETVQN
ncbi:hypothetical protein [Paenibacillus thermotolerans]|uniref:hypothetical protein n=1 Tax=Paenibacillus thermotolerans TaxID=3027807 RepID=UPI0023680531|nr:MULTISPECIES: hypothetical protein [unclassified Paenibacillus]